MSNMKLHIVVVEKTVSTAGRFFWIAWFKQFLNQIFFECSVKKLNRNEWQLSSDKVILFHNNTRPHVVHKVKQAFYDLEWEIFSHSTYSPDIAQSDYHLFRLMQHAMLSKIHKIKQTSRNESMTCMKKIRYSCYAVWK